MNDDIAISVRNLVKRFGSFTAVDNISFDVRRGEIFGFLGANGAGKTTAMRMLCGLSRPTSGSGTVAGFDIMRQSEEIKRHIGTLGMENLTRTLVRDIPTGWKQKLAFSAATIHTPEVVFLDEPTGGVDPVTRRKFWEMIYRTSSEGTTIFVTTHYLDEAEYCNRVSIMVDGRIKALDSPANLKKIYGADNMDEVFRIVAKDAKRGD